MSPKDPDETGKISAGDGCLYIIRDQKILVDLTHAQPRIPGNEIAARFDLHIPDGYRIGVHDKTDCYALRVPAGTEAPPGMNFLGLRRLFGMLDPEHYAMAVRATGILNWDRTCRFCSTCGSEIKRHPAILAKQCEACGFTMFPRISPAVIVAVEKDGRILLARASRFTENLYSVLAGFAEPGESLEDTVRREIREEVGIEVKDIRYFGSQPWPYPDSLMIGFTALWSSGDIAVDNDEITDARWFSVEDLPLIPDRISIARSLIDAFIEKMGKR